MQLTIQVPNDINRMKQIVKLLWKVLMWVGANVIEHCAQRLYMQRCRVKIAELSHMQNVHWNTI
jgi:hypothetical protein